MATHTMLISGRCTGFVKVYIKFRLHDNNNKAGDFSKAPRRRRVHRGHPGAHCYAAKSTHVLFVLTTTNVNRISVEYSRLESQK